MNDLRVASEKSLPSYPVLIKQYLESYKDVWSELTLKTETSRVKQVAKLIEHTPSEAWATILNYKPYTRRIMWCRLCSFYDWLLEEGYLSGKNPYKKWQVRNRRLFKNAYQKTLPDMSFEEAERRINTIEDQALRQKALQLLYTGLRWSESFDEQAIEKKSVGETLPQVTGKGGKKRPVFGILDQVPKAKKSSLTPIKHGRMWYTLKKIGLSPHMLRKLFATKLAKNGLGPIELCRVMGWDKFQTAESYIQMSTDDRLANKIRKMIRVKTTL